MSPLFILAIVAALFIGFLVLQVWWRYSKPTPPTRRATLTPVDLDAFENLTDPAEEEYLRTNLSPGEFRIVQRSRIRAARMYVSALSGNATALVAVGQSARLHPDPVVAASAQEFVQQAIRLKVWCLLAECRLDAALVFPNLMSPSNAVARRYVAVKHLAANLPQRSAA